MGLSHLRLNELRLKEEEAAKRRKREKEAAV